MSIGPQDISSQLQARLQALAQQVQHARATLQPQHRLLDEAYSRVFDSLESTLHNLERSKPAEKQTP